MQLRGSRAIAFLLAAAILGACGRKALRSAAGERATAADTIVRVALAVANPSGRVSASSQLSLVDGATGTVFATSRAGVAWVVRPEGRDGILASSDGVTSIVVRSSPLLLRADSRSGVVTYEGRRFRGTLVVWRSGDNLVFVNQLPVEEYLLGVVPQEIGIRRANETAAVAAQAVAARSFTYARVQARRRDATRLYDLVAGVSDQVYGGMDSEVEQSSQAVRQTRNLVLKSAGRVIEAVYSSACGGATAAATEVWSADNGQPYLEGVSDAIPGGSGSWCDIAPVVEWKRTIAPAELVSGVDAYLRNYVDVSGRITRVDSIVTGATSTSGRITSLVLATDRGRHEISGDKIRFVLRPLGGEILRSTLFRLASASGPTIATGSAPLEIHGRGYGHGVGMCQWGAIGRARAGHDFRSILAAYFPGTQLEQVAKSVIPANAGIQSR